MGGQVMSKVIIAKKPDLSFLTINKKNKESSSCPLPIIIKKDGSLDWDANHYLTEYGGGPNVYNISPLATTVEKKAYNLNLFCHFIEDCSPNLSDINDSTLYQYVESLKKRCVTDQTIISHIRTALGYIVQLDHLHPEWNLATHEKKPKDQFGVHYTIRKYRLGKFDKEYLNHRCLDGLINIAAVAEFIHDDEFEKWLDAINVTKLHPELNDSITYRWQALGTLLDITGSRISEVHKITRTMIKKAAYGLLDPATKHTLRNIPITKGKYKGKTRQIPATKEDLQIILLYINLVEDMFPNIKHDAIFVDLESGAPLKQSYLKNYARKVLNNSPYGKELRHIINHSFRHRFITLHIAKAILKMSKYGSFSNILEVAANACRKITMHASNETLSNYIHLATEINERNNDEYQGIEKISSQIRIKLKKMLNVSKRLQINEINETEALKLLLLEINKLKKFGLENMSEIGF
jgi:integrase